jgi:hypothetical protein
MDWDDPNLLIGGGIAAPARQQTPWGNDPRAIEARKISTMVGKQPDVVLPLAIGREDEALTELKAHWRAIGGYVDYLQLKSLGYAQADPSLSTDCPPELGLYMRAYGLELMRLLQLLVGDVSLEISGFTLCRDWAIANGREFPWGSPRELFCAIVEFRGRGSWHELRNPKGNKTATQEERRQELKWLQGKFSPANASPGDWRNPRKEDLQASYSLGGHEGDVDSLWKAALEPHKNQPEIKRYWADYIAAYKNVLALMRGPAYVKKKLDRHGIPQTPNRAGSG